ncbi:BRO1-domain-containing protein [Colletotrichum zoysiae]|uniref:BRO1-domain-containing protein n=1 Tax=Colletotrichum zoysiae TaxID=1216348 RepID=A0AAD9LXE1_9PEZI|nr:BRO1-domain-containing protein [Colletotrichum zoysiae]
MFHQDLEVIDAQSRNPFKSIARRKPHPSGIKKLQAYAGHLVGCGQREGAAPQRHQEAAGVRRTSGGVRSTGGSRTPAAPRSSRRTPDIWWGAVNGREPHPSGIKAYAWQPVWIGGKFPIDIGAEFTWGPALGYNTERPMVRNNLKYELMNILYNLASLYSQLAVAQSRGGKGLKAGAAGYFALAIGVLDHMRKGILPELRSWRSPKNGFGAEGESRGW